MTFFVSQCHHRTQDRFWTGQLSWMALGSSAGVNKLICSSIENKVDVIFVSFQVPQKVLLSSVSVTTQ